MKSINRYSILKEEGLIIQFHQNELKLDGMKKLKLDIINDPDFDPNFVFLIDVKNAQIMMTTDELAQYGNFVSANLKLKGARRLAILTTNSNQVVKSVIYTQNSNLKPLVYEIFSTLDGALNWLGVDTFNLKIIASEIKKLKNANMLTDYPV
jgi:hypothetical protein